MNASSFSASSEGQLPADDPVDDWHLLSPESAVPQHLHTSRDEQEVEDKGKLKSKLVSAWNSIKYGLFHPELSLFYFMFLARLGLTVLFLLVLGHETLFPFMFQVGP